MPELYKPITFNYIDQPSLLEIQIHICASCRRQVLQDLSCGIKIALEMKAGLPDYYVHDLIRGVVSSFKASCSCVAFKPYYLKGHAFKGKIIPTHIPLDTVMTACTANVVFHLINPTARKFKRNL